MWNHYRDNFLPTQLIILFVCAAMWLVMHMPALGIVTFFVAMQLGFVAGAAWAARLRRRMLARRERLPLR